jgi:hypothetical protein
MEVSFDDSCTKRRGGAHHAGTGLGIRRRAFETRLAGTRSSNFIDLAGLDHPLPFRDFVADR